MNKSYIGQFCIGAQTASYDMETEVKDHRDYSYVTEDLIINTANDFLGEQKQLPPVFSAKNVNGKRAYEIARKGNVVGLKLVDIRINKFVITKIDIPYIDFSIECTKGTYIRSIARDFGERLGCGAYLTKLRRTQIGNYTVENALSIEEIEFLFKIEGNNL